MLGVQERHPFRYGHCGHKSFTIVCSTFKHQRVDLVAISFDVAILSDSLVVCCWGDHSASGTVPLFPVHLHNWEA